MTQNHWFKPDNAGKIYPAFANKKDPATFRVAAILKSSVDKDSLQIALEKTLASFPSLAVTLKRGVFWYYLDENPNRPLVKEECLLPCAYVDPNKSQGYLFQVYYYDRHSPRVFPRLDRWLWRARILKGLAFQLLFNDDAP